VTWPITTNLHDYERIQQSKMEQYTNKVAIQLSFRRHNGIVNLGTYDARAAL
jgi:hypothetical protein